MRPTRLLLAALTAVGLAACATPPPAPQTSSAAAPAPAPASPSTPVRDYQACLVADASGFADGSFNQAAHNGLLRAGAELGIETAQRQSDAAADYDVAIDALIGEGCELITVVGAQHAASAEAAAAANPQVDFLLVDAMPTTPQPNLKPLLFDVAGAAFLAGYLAASQSATGAVGTFGAIKDADIVVVLDGFAAGVQHYNQAKAAEVRLLGWDPATQEGVFVASDSPFEDAVAGRAAAQSLAAQGADIIFPVAGQAGTGALELAGEAPGSLAVIWNDTDGCLSHPQSCPVIMTSVAKAVDLAVFDTITQAADGQFSNSAYHGTLANEGAGLSPLHEFTDKVGELAWLEVQAVRKGLIDGTIEPPAAG